MARHSVRSGRVAVLVLPGQRSPDARSPATKRAVRGRRAGGAVGPVGCGPAGRVLPRNTVVVGPVGAGSARAVSADHTVYLWDMLGYGASTMADGQDVSLGRQAALLNDLLGLLGADRTARRRTRLRRRGGPARASAPRGAVQVVGACRRRRARAVGLEVLRLVGGAEAGRSGSGFPRCAGAGSCARAGRRRPPTPSGRRPRHAHRPLAGQTGGLPAFYRQIAQADQRYTDEIEPRYPTLELPVQVVWARGGHLDPGGPGAPARRIDPRRPAEALQCPNPGASSSLTRRNTSRPCWCAGWARVF